MERLTDRTEKGLAYLINVKPDEQVVESPYKNTLQCILDCFDRLAAYEDTGLTPEEVNACTALREKQEREKGCVWCNENNKVFHDGQHFHLFCSYCGKRLEVERDG